MIYDIFTTQSENLPQCVQNFLLYLGTIKGKSKNTIEGYRSDLTVFFRFLLLYKRKIPGNTPFEAIDLRQIDTAFIDTIVLNDLFSFLLFVEKYRENGTHARARKVATLKSFFHYLYAKEKAIHHNPAAELESPKLQKRQPVYLSLDQSINLLQSLNPKKKNYTRDYCILTIFLNCGLRLSELCNIKISSIHQDTLTIIGKGNKERTVYLNEACLDAIQNYLSQRLTIETDPLYKDYLFLSTHKTPISRRSVEVMVKKCVTDANIVDADRYTPHKLRHTAATLMYQNGVDIRKLQAILGHESISTTEIYTHINEDSLREAVKSNPLANIKGNL